VQKGIMRTLDIVMQHLIIMTTLFAHPYH